MQVTRAARVGSEYRVTQAAPANSELGGSEKGSEKEGPTKVTQAVQAAQAAQATQAAPASQGD